jgi:hypothetical protein
LENNLNTFCETEKSYKNIKVSYKDINGKGIFQSIKYIELFCGIDLLKIKCFEEIKFFNKIRNALVHNNSIIYEDKIKSSRPYKEKFIELKNTLKGNDNKTYGEIQFNKNSVSVNSPPDRVPKKKIYKQK